MRTNDNKKSSFCSVCSKPGHLTENCFQVVGFPEWWDRTKPSFSGRGAGSGNRQVRGECGGCGGRGQHSAYASQLSNPNSSHFQEVNNQFAQPSLFTNMNFGDQWRVLSLTPRSTQQVSGTNLAWQPPPRASPAPQHLRFSLSASGSNFSGPTPSSSQWATVAKINPMVTHHLSQEHLCGKIFWLFGFWCIKTCDWARDILLIFHLLILFLLDCLKVLTLGLLLKVVCL